MHLQSILKQAVEAGCACRCVHLRGPSFWDRDPLDCLVAWQHHPSGNEWLFYFADALLSKDGWDLGTLSGSLGDDDDFYLRPDGVLPPKHRPFETCAWAWRYFDSVMGTTFVLKGNASCEVPAPEKLLAAWRAVADEIPLPPVGQRHDIAVMAIAYVVPDDRTVDSPGEIWWRYTPHVCFYGCGYDASAGPVVDASEYGCDYYYGGGVIVPLEQNEEFNLP